MSCGKSEGHTQQGIVPVRYGYVHELPRDRIKNAFFPGVMPAVIFEKGAEQKAKDVHIDARLSARAVQERRIYLKNEAMIGGMLELKLSKYRPNRRSRPRKASYDGKKTLLMQEDMSIECLVQKRKRAHSLCVKAAFREPVGYLFKRGT